MMRLIWQLWHSVTPDQYPLKALCRRYSDRVKVILHMHMIKTWWWGRLHADQDVGQAHCYWRRRPPKCSSPLSSLPISSHLSLMSAGPPSSFSLRNNNLTLLCRRTESAERVSVVLHLLQPALNSSQPELLLTPGKLRSVNWVTLILAVFFGHLDHLRRAPRGGEVGEVGREKRRGDVLIFLTLS